MEDRGHSSGDSNVWSDLPDTTSSKASSSESDGRPDSQMDCETRSVSATGSDELSSAASQTDSEARRESEMVPVLLEILGDHSDPKSQIQVQQSLVKTQKSKKSLMVRHLDSVFDAMQRLITYRSQELANVAGIDDAIEVLDQALYTVGVLANMNPLYFAENYRRFTHSMELIIHSAGKPELKLKLNVLLGKTIQCMSLICRVVTHKRIISDGSDLMDKLLGCLMKLKDITSDDPQLTYVIMAWANVTGMFDGSNHFKHYLKYAIEPVLRAATISEEHIAQENPDEERELENIWEEVSYEDKPTVIERALTAIRLLGGYARDYTTLFVEHLERAVEVMVVMIKFPEDSVRYSAAHCLKNCLNCQRTEGEDKAVHLGPYICNIFLDAIDREPRLGVMYGIIDAFNECARIMEKDFFTQASLAKLVLTLDKIFVKFFERLEDRLEFRRLARIPGVVALEGFEEQRDTLTNDAEGDDDLIESISTLLELALDSHKADLALLFEPLMSHVVKLMNPVKSLWFQVQLMLQILARVIEYGGTECAIYKEQYLPSLKKVLDHWEAPVRRTAADCVAKMAEFGGGALSVDCAECTEVMVNQPDILFASITGRTCATEAIVSAVTKVLEHTPSDLVFHELLPYWLNMLPITHESCYVQYVLGYFCSLLDRDDRVLIGHSNCNAPTILRIILKYFQARLVTKESVNGTKMIQFITQLEQHAILPALAREFSSDQTETLEHIFE